jgi:serine/threonine protein kinase
MTISWHADIKPENILRVYGEFKLGQSLVHDPSPRLFMLTNATADFGFAKFSDFNWNQQIPTNFIDGGTAAYGK